MHEPDPGGHGVQLRGHTGAGSAVIDPPTRNLPKSAIPNVVPPRHALQSSRRDIHRQSNVVVDSFFGLAWLGKATMAEVKAQGAPEWQNIIKERLMAKQAESEVHREMIDQCTWASSGASPCVRRKSAWTELTFS